MDELLEQVGSNFKRNKKEKDWIITLLQCNFFTMCSRHQALAKNEVKTFCIDCGTGFCRHCNHTRYDHRHFQICKYASNIVVRLQHLEEHLDCSEIQTYLFCGEKVIHLKPRPRLKSVKHPRRSKGSCNFCGCFFESSVNNFCSIACKFTCSTQHSDHSSETINSAVNILVKEDEREERQQSGENQSSLSLTDISVEAPGSSGSEPKPKKQMHRRKGIPRRSHFR